MIVVAALLLLAQSAPPDATEQQAVLARVREYAIGYSQGLQNFICTKVTTRTGDSSGKGKWKLLETREQELTFVNGRESYRLVKVNGTPPGPENRLKEGFTTIAGEFASLAHIFRPATRADVSWDHDEGPAETRSCVFRYRVTAESGAGMVFRSGSRRFVLAHHGLVYADCRTGAVMRLVLDVEPHPDAGAHIEIVYGPVIIGSKQFLLPKTALDVVRADKRLTKAEVTFQNYRKYDADSSIRFDAGEP